MLQRLGNSLRNFMYGRNGVDALSWVLLVLSILLNFAGSLTSLGILCLLAYVPLCLSIYRMFSKNIAKRYQENQKLTQWFSRLKGRKNYRYFRCPGCKTRVRVPKGKGTLRITCPSCREKFTKKT